MRALLVLAIVSVLNFAAPAVAQPADTATSTGAQSTQDLARRYILVGGTEDLFIDGAAYGFRQGARAQGVELTPNQWHRVRAAVREEFREAAEIFLNDLVTFYARSAPEDLTAALAYYESAPGQRYVAASLAYTYPLTLYLATQGRIPLEDAPAAASIDPARLTRGRELAEALVAKMHPSERAAVELTSFGIEGLTDYVARSLASQLEISDLEGALAWVNTPESMRIEGPSAERTLAIQTATMRSMHAVDVPRLSQAVQAIMRESPPT